MVKLKEKVNKAKLFRDLQKHADEVYKTAWESEYAKVQFMEGAKTLFELLRLGDVSKTK
jgi:hypothetical protein